jgi:hypothetical protein
MRHESMATPAAELNAHATREFGAREGRVGGVFEETPLVLLHHAGDESGAARVHRSDTCAILGAT